MIALVLILPLQHSYEKHIEQEHNDYELIITHPAEFPNPVITAVARSRFHDIPPRMRMGIAAPATEKGVEANSSIAGVVNGDTSTWKM